MDGSELDIRRGEGMRGILKLDLYLVYAPKNFESRNSKVEGIADGK